MPTEKGLYEILGVARTATPEEIKSAYRQLARELHPDRTLNDPPHIRTKKERRFKEVSAANMVLSNLDSRTRYDRETEPAKTWSGKPKHPFGQGFDGFVDRLNNEGVHDGNIDDLFEEFFGMTKQFKKDMEAKQKTEGQGSIFGLMEDLFGVDIKPRKK